MLLRGLTSGIALGIGRRFRLLLPFALLPLRLPGILAGGTFIRVVLSTPALLAWQFGDLAWGLV